MSRRAGSVLVATLAAACGQTGLVLEVQGPNELTSVEAGITELELVTAQHSWCDRWVQTAEGSGLRFSVEDQDLDASPITILLSPDDRTDLMEPVQPTILARDRAGRVVGVAGFDPMLFQETELRRFVQRISLLARTEGVGPRYLTEDGCVCLPGQPWIGRAGAACDARVITSFADLVATASCELPPGAPLPIGVCDGQLYPGERANRRVPCYATHDGICRVGTRTCNDEEGRAFDRGCAPSESAPALPSTALCDAFLACEQEACTDPVPCLKAALPQRRALTCVLPIAAEPLDGVVQACPGGSWAAPVTATSSTMCAAAMLDGTRQGPVTVGWQEEGQTSAAAASSLCPPTLLVQKIDVADPSRVPEELTFTVAIDEQLFDVSLKIKIGCDPNLDAEANDLRCAAF